jgi:hypothetical protein
MRRENVFLDACKKNEGQTAAKAGKMIAFIGRLKPPSSTVVQAFLSGL